MHFAHVLQAVDTHTAGEPTRIVTSGLPALAGATMAERREFLQGRLDRFRSALVREPRGHDAIVVAFLTPPVSPGAHTGVVFANDVGYLGMCGHGAIGVATMLVQTGVVAAEEPLTQVRLDTPAGMVECAVRVRGGRVTSVLLHNVPAFVQDLDLRVPVPGMGELTVDVAYGGNWFAILPARAVGLSVASAQLPELLDASMRIRAALEAHGVRGRDPRGGAGAPIDHVELTEEEEAREGVRARTFTLCPGRSYDRSPCGTGTSAKLAVLHARGKLAPGAPFHNHSVLGTRFEGRIAGTAPLGDRTAVLPTIEGSAWITGFATFVLDPDDPLVHGIA